MKTDVGQWRTRFLKPSPCMDRRPLPSPDSRGAFTRAQGFRASCGAFRRSASGGTPVNAAGRTVRLFTLLHFPRGRTVQNLNPYIYVPPKPRLAGFPFSLVYEATDLPPASAGGHKGNRSPKRASAWLLEKTSAAARKPCARLARAPLRVTTKTPPPQSPVITAHLNYPTGFRRSAGV